MLGWTTGIKLFQLFACHLKDSVLDDWTDQVQGINQTVLNFDEQLALFIEPYFSDLAYSNQKDYLMRCKKPRSLSVRMV